MDILDLIRKLYDEKADPADLAQGLDEERLAELRRLVEAKDAIDGLPPRRPSAASLEAITEMAKQSQRETNDARRKTILFSPHFIQRYAAAAVVVLAVGIGYLTLQSPILTVDSVEPTLNGARDLVDADEPASEMEESPADEAPANIGALAVRRPMSNESNAPKKSKRSREFDESKVEEQLAAAATPKDDLFAEEMIAFDARPGDDTALGGKNAFAGTTFDLAFDTMAWEDGLELRTFYWQVQALGQRSPQDSDWEEGVPLEGSFRILEGASRNPALLEARSEQ